MQSLGREMIRHDGVLHDVQPLGIHVTVSE